MKEDGEPVTGDREMTFRLYTDNLCTDQVGSDRVYTVPVDHGLFNVDLLVSHAEFNGQALWLETEVGGIAVGCQAIQAVPYALSLRPGAVISGSVNSAAALAAVNTGTEGPAIVGLSSTGSNDDLHPEDSYYKAGGEFAGPNGVIGAAAPAYNDGYGVTGLAQGTNGRGIFGYASSPSGYNYGVYGQSASSTGFGVYGDAAASTGSTYGVYGRSYSEEGHGVHGYAAAITGTTYGVSGKSYSPYGAGGYFANTRDTEGIDLVVGGGAGDDGIIASEPDDPDSDLFLSSNDEVWIRLDQNDDEDGHFEIQNGTEDTVLRVDETGDVSQPQTADGLVKAAVTLYCSNGTSYVTRYFNNSNSVEITVSSGTNPGECTIDFGFQVSDRFWSATAVYGAQRIVTCDYGSSDTELDCYRYRPDGDGVSGQIIIVIY